MYGAIDLGGTNIKAAIVRPDGHILARQSEPTNAKAGPDAVLAQMRRCVEWLCRHEHPIQAVGVGVPGVVNPEDGCAYHPPNLSDWKVVPVRSTLAAFCSRPLFVDNDANAGGIGEAEAGNGRDAESFLYLTLGTGVGGAIILNKKLYRGERGGAAEIGHIIVREDVAPETTEPGFRAGTMEEYIGREGLIDFVREFVSRAGIDSPLRDKEHFDVADISVAAHEGDPAALACFRRAGQILGAGLASVLAILDLQVVIVGGGISQAHPLLLDTARETLRERAIPTVAERAVIRLARFGKDAGLVGAAMLAKNALDRPRTGNLVQPER